MYTVEFDNGISVDFEKEPTKKDIDEVFAKISKPTKTVPATPTQPKKKTGIGDKILNAGTAVTNFLGGGAIADTFGSELAKIGKSQQEKDIISREQPTVGQTVGSGIQLGATLLPVGGIAAGITKGATSLGIKTGASALGKIGAGAATGYAFDVGANLQEGKTGTQALKPGLGTAIGTAIPAAGVAKNVISRSASKQAPRVINSLIKPLQKDFSYGKNPGRAVAEAKIVANSFDELATKINSTRQTTGQEIGALGRKLSTKPVLNISNSLSPLDDAMKVAASQNNQTLLNRLSSVKKSIVNNLGLGVDDAGNSIIKELGPRKLNGLTFSEGRDILGTIGDITQFTGNPSDDKAVNAALKLVYGNIKGETLKVADSLNPTLGKQFRKLTEKYADLHSAEIATKYRDKIVERSNLVGLSPQMAGIGSGLITLIATGGAATPAVLVGVAGAALDKAAQSPAFKTRLAAALAQKSPQEISTILQKAPALAKFLETKGAKTPGDMFLKSSLGQKAKTSLGESLKNPSMGLAIKDISKTPESVAKLIDKEDAGIIRNYLSNNSIGAYEKGQKLMESMGISKADPKVQKRFLQEVLDNSPYGKGKDIPVKNLDFKAGATPTKLGNFVQDSKTGKLMGSQSKQPLVQEARKYKSAEEFKANLTPKQLREVLNETESAGKVASAKATGATKRGAGDYLYSQDRGAFDALLSDIKTGTNLDDPIHSQLTDIWNKANKNKGK